MCIVDLHERLVDIEDDPTLDDLAERYESVFDAMFCAFGAGWDLVVDVACRDGSAMLEVSTYMPSDLSEGFLQYVGEALDIDIRNMRMLWVFRDGGWQLDTAQTGFVGIDGTADTVELDLLCEVMETAAANGACVPADTSKQ